MRQQMFPVTAVTGYRQKSVSRGVCFFVRQHMKRVFFLFPPFLSTFSVLLRNFI